MGLWASAESLPQVRFPQATGAKTMPSAGAGIGRNVRALWRAGAGVSDGRSGGGEVGAELRRCGPSDSRTLRR